MAPTGFGRYAGKLRTASAYGVTSRAALVLGASVTPRTSG
jgi:hypothetical protein